MKKQQVVLVIIGFILLALMATNPSIEDHRQAVLEKMNERLSQASDGDNQWEKVGQAIGVALGQGIVEKAVSRENYLLFSITKISFKDKTKDIGYGAFGKVWVLEKLYEGEIVSNTKTNFNSVKNSKPFTDIGELLVLNEVRYGTSQVALEFEKELRGTGWRIPNLEDYKKIEPYCANLDMIRGKRFWCTNYYLDFEEKSCQNCDTCDDNIMAYPIGELHIVLVKDPN